ncbi:molybdopterin-guanine dinucleotide biosynthesis protein B [Hoeflea sp. WL0058]|uniref:Molybdopterin-guanine dinucleotide biosynthesis protein B n=1 Tax=Flavimaribacter sediminis TaxID=2865987 RepID=A0AAE2ZGY1_9HYPH|nr:molybdopterin-guanine dinucleotide biosynthesis protein B [Flavimaribacter sediminis]
MKPRIFGIAGWKNSGKTGLTVRLVEELSRRGWRVSTVKHAHHAFDVDQKGKDSRRHREAGAGEVMIVSQNRWALMHELRGEDEPNFGSVIDRLSPCDIVIVEGYKREDHPKIETRRLKPETGKAISDGNSSFVAIASDHPVDGALPVFDLDDTVAIADFVERHTGLRR